MIVIISTSARLLQINRPFGFDIGLFRLIDVSSGECIVVQKLLLILGFGRRLTTEYRVLTSSWYSAEPSSRTEYRFSPKNYQAPQYHVKCLQKRWRLFGSEQDFVVRNRWSERREWRDRLLSAVFGCFRHPP